MFDVLSTKKEKSYRATFTYDENSKNGHLELHCADAFIKM